MEGGLINPLALIRTGAAKGVTSALLRYLYRLENGLPNFNWGLRPDLAQRMAGTGFQPLPSSQLELEAQRHGAHDGARHEPGGLLAQLAALPELHPDRWGQGS